MIYFKYKNKTDLEIPFKQWVSEIKLDLLKIDKSCFPITIIIDKSDYDEDKDHYKYSHFVPDDNLMEIFVLPGASLDEIKWSFMHEFRHFMQRNMPEIYAATFDNNDNIVLKDLVARIKELNSDDFYDTFHDLLPHESDAIVYATEKVGKNYRKHPLKIGIKKYIDNDEHNDDPETEL